MIRLTTLTESEQQTAPAAKYATPAEREYRMQEAVKAVTIGLTCTDAVIKAADPSVDEETGTCLLESPSPDCSYQPRGHGDSEF